MTAPKNQSTIFWINLTVGLGTIGLWIGSFASYIAPLKTLPPDVREIQRVQAVHTEVLKSLTIESDAQRTTRHELERAIASTQSSQERSNYRIESLEKKVDRLEK